MEPTAGIHPLGQALVPSIGHDPFALSRVPVPNLPSLVGVRLHVQGINALTATGRPLLTNSIVGTVR